MLLPIDEWNFLIYTHVGTKSMIPSRGSRPFWQKVFSKCVWEAITDTWVWTYDPDYFENKMKETI